MLIKANNNFSLAVKFVFRCVIDYDGGQPYLL